jgi:hypothetical protein
MPFLAPPSEVEKAAGRPFRRSDMKNVCALGVTALLALATGAQSAFAHSREPGNPPEDAARGLVYRGLERSGPGGPCETGFVLRVRGGRVGCTHGPDPAPPGRDVRRQRALSELTAAFGGEGGEGSATMAPAAPCFGDGVSGNRVQAVYAYPLDGPDNYHTVAPLIRRWAAVVDQVFNDSAAETGGVRHVRFVTDPACQVDVAKVALSADGVSSFVGTVNDLAAQGHNRADRKYLVWVDAYVMCGMAEVMADERATSQNVHDGHIPMLARVDRACWGWAERSVEAHELAHTLGAVQPGAPNGTALFHCVDEADLMCYDDDGTLDGIVNGGGRSTALSWPCSAPHERLLDCNHDDYFHTDPPGGTYLSRSWNVAQSSFLTAEGPPSIPDSEAPVASRPLATPHGVLGRSRVTVRVHMSATDNGGGIAGYWLWQSTDGGPFTPVAASPLPDSADVRLRPGHRYGFVVQAVDFAGNLSPAAYGPTFVLRTLQERSASYSPSWRRRYSRPAHRRFQSSTYVRQAQARFAFVGRSVAWVARMGSKGGAARVYVDGAYVRTVDLYSTTPVARKVVFTRRWASSGVHTLTIRSVSTSAKPRVSVDAFVVLR